MQQVRDEELMLSYQKGDMQAMNELLLRYKNPVYRFVFRISNNCSEAEDIAQEVFLKVHEFRSSYLPIGKFSTWIFTIAHNLGISRLRKRKWLVSWPRKQDDPEELIEFESPEPSPQEIAAENDLSVKIKECIQCLPFLQKEALVLREYENLDYKEVGRILKKTQATVKSLIYRARQNLKKKLLPYIGEYKGGSDV
ncbi:MAG: RNA polymerase sigma factor [Candidatus Firestonebacteria bacterium]